MNNNFLAGKIDCVSSWQTASDYRFCHWGALLALFNPNFFLSLILGSLFKKPASFNTGLNSELNKTKALARPCLKASA
jgi:hypothetical protein